MKNFRNKRTLAFCLLWSVIGPYTCVAADLNTITAQLGGFQEVPPISTTGSGVFKGLISRESIAYTLNYSNLQGNVSAIQLQFGQPGVNGGIITFLCGGDGKAACPTAGTVTGSITPSDIRGPAEQGIAGAGWMDVLTAIGASMIYVNISSDKFPAGEIRGQIRVDTAVNTPTDSGIKGKVMLGPFCSAQQEPPDPKCADRPYGAVVIVKALDGMTEISRFSSDSEGDFHVSIPPGLYVLASQPSQRPFLKPVTVAVESGKFTSVTITFDTGVR